MKKSKVTIPALAMICLGASLLTFGKDKPGPVSGTWACVAHGTDQGDINYTYNLLQAGEKITGTFSESADDSQKAEIRDGSYKDKKLNFIFDAHNGTVTITGAFAKAGAMSGSWSHSGGSQGTWDCSKGEAKTASK
jgi:hypothetical protein